MITEERTSRTERVVNAAMQMLTAARTAPKTKGNDLVELALVSGDDMKRLSAEMERLCEERKRPGLGRDAATILRGECVMLVGVKTQPIGLNCRHCGYPSCADKPEQTPCVFNSIDVGIALGSACATAADLRLDTRVMYSVGLAAQQLGWLKDCSLVQGIAISASSKSPFFDRG